MAPGRDRLMSIVVDLVEVLASRGTWRFGPDSAVGICERV